MMRGRKPKLAKLKILHGSQRVNEGEPKAERATIDPPSHLSAAAKTVWRKLAPVVDSMGILTEADAEQFGHLCELVCSRRRLAKIISTKGELLKETVLTSNGNPVVKLKPNPAMQPLRSVEKELRQLGGLFGLDPTSRSRINADASRRDEFEDYLNDSAAS
jgi:P27 family predicted phage terminase small subunit